ncbi:uncharacterized protein LOC110053106 [Orbicella faveolata]|uniref:uncharacterized protein LOC110053106 n=1 Tax=Orbicella faveolata TaxID=48498 RepID=UPI0009E4E20F|nr:uncharacterized protein LOC110053106 [Orbicella faveolata]
MSFAIGEGFKTKGAMEQIVEANMNPDNHHSPPGEHLSFYQGERKKYDDLTKGSAYSRAASNVANVGQILLYPTRLTVPSIFRLSTRIITKGGHLFRRCKTRTTMAGNFEQSVN